MNFRREKNLQCHDSSTLRCCLLSFSSILWIIVIFVPCACFSNAFPLYFLFLSDFIHFEPRVSLSPHLQLAPGFISLSCFHSSDHFLSILTSDFFLLVSCMLPVCFLCFYFYLFIFLHLVLLLCQLLFYFD